MKLSNEKYTLKSDLIDKIIGNHYVVMFDNQTKQCLFYKEYETKQDAEIKFKELHKKCLSELQP